MEYFALASLLLVSLVHNAPITEARSRIISGQAAAAGQYPFAAAITVRLNLNGADFESFCTGSLISNQFVLTAAQCCENAVSFTIQVGSNSLTAVDSNRQILITTSYSILPAYNNITFANDICLVKFRLPISLNDFVRPAKLPDYEPPALPEGTALGWGLTSDDDPEYSELLNYVTLANVPFDECRRIYGEAITSYTLCTEGNDNEGTCYGDTGGPFMYQLANGDLWQVGVASFLSPFGCEYPHPSGFTQVYPYLTWIKGITNIP